MSKVSIKGQTTIPKDIRKLLGILPGDEVEFLHEGGEVIVRKKSNAHVLNDYIGYLGKGRTDKIMGELRGKYE